MTPILRNRHEKVQEASINLIGRIGEHYVRFLLLHVNVANCVVIPQLTVALNSYLHASGCVSVSSS